MKKKNLFKILILVTILTLCGIGIMLFLGKIHRIFLIESEKEIINKQVGEESTIVDVTGIIAGEETEHEHVYKTMYDDNKHWEECTVCGEKRNEVVHSLKTIWPSGSATCYEETFAIKTCSCGYSMKWHKPCVWDGKTYYTANQNKTHFRRCKICNGRIYDDYYLNSYGNGNLHDVEYNTKYVDVKNPVQEKCYKADGSEITCSNLGKCVVCGYNYTNIQHYFNILQYARDNNEEMPYETGKIFCYNCKKEFGTYTNEISKDSNVPATYTVITNLKLINGATFNSVGSMRNVGISWQTNTQTVTKINSDKTEVTLMTKAKFPSTYKIGYYSNVNFRINADNVSEAVMLPISSDVYIYPDSVKPSILSIDIGNNLLNDWSKSKTIVVSGTENWTNTVKVKIVDDSEEIVFSGETNVTNGAYSISCTPELEAGVEGRTFKAIVTDACENNIEQEFTISKIDAIAPEFTSGNEIGGEWAREKNFTFKATDKGIGNVQIAFNDVADYKLATKNGTEYSRDYRFIGDVYSPTKARVFYKDELNNIASQEITIDKIDNTAPTIVVASVHNNKLNIMANDEKDGLGEGSGIVKYRYITSTEKITNPNITAAANEVGKDEAFIIEDIDKIKYVYFVAEDLVRKCK